VSVCVLKCSSLVLKYFVSESVHANYYLFYSTQRPTYIFFILSIRCIKELYDELLLVYLKCLSELYLIAYKLTLYPYHVIANYLITCFVDKWKNIIIASALRKIKLCGLCGAKSTLHMMYPRMFHSFFHSFMSEEAITLHVHIFIYHTYPAV